MNSVTPTIPPNNADANQDLAPDELDANIAEEINKAGHQVNGTI
jgi:hypothetical protein